MGLRTPSTDINTKEFWVQVRKEYQPGYEFGICCSSYTFCTMWNHTTIRRYKDPDTKIMAFAEEFLETIKLHNKEMIRVTSGYLFETAKVDVDRVDLRKAFLDYMVNKFS